MELINGKQLVEIKFNCYYCDKELPDIPIESRDIKCPYCKNIVVSHSGKTFIHSASYRLCSEYKIYEFIYSEGKDYIIAHNKSEAIYTFCDEDKIVLEDLNDYIDSYSELSNDDMNNLDKLQIENSSLLSWLIKQNNIEIPSIIASTYRYY